jgi:amidohydrolase
MNRLIAIFVAGLVLTPASLLAQTGPATYRPQQQAAVSAWLKDNLDSLVATCKHLHANPELSLHEERTAAYVAEQLGRCGCQVTPAVGGHGVVGVLANGAGPTVLIRGDMDALPITEDNNLEYASKVRVDRPDGTTVGVMHACGHDIHTTTVIGAARLLSAIRDQWRGTVVLIAQPAEEGGGGAKLMIADGLFERFPRPDFCLSLHVSHKLPVGQIAYTSGWDSANVDSVDITIFGRGGHGARPNTTVDPIVAAAYVITELQTIVSRRINPVQPAVVTVGTIHGGSAHNIIPDEVKLGLTVRSYQDSVRQQLLDGIRQITTDVCRSFGCPRPPLIEIEDDYLPSGYNDPALTRSAAAVFGEIFGKDNVIEEPAEMGGEDFGLYARHLKVPGLQYSLGTVSRETYEASLRPDGPPLPSLHSSKYVADLAPSVDAGVRSMTILTLSLLAAGS